MKDELRYAVTWDLGVCLDHLTERMPSLESFICRTRNTMYIQEDKRTKYYLRSLCKAKIPETANPQISVAKPLLHRLCSLLHVNSET